MKTNTFMKILISVLAIVMAFSCILPVLTNATDWKSTTQFDGESGGEAASSARKIVGAILAVTRIVGTGVAIIMLIVLAMKYMMSAPGERADIKKHAVIYVVGAVVLFASSGILGIIQKFSDNIN